MRRCHMIALPELKCRPRLCVLFAATLPWSAALPQGASVTADPGLSASQWLWRWAPLHTIGNLGLPAPEIPDLPRTLDLSPPRVGLFWTAGNPAAIVDEIDSAFTLVATTTRVISGPYRRPLDAKQSSSIGVSIGGWRRVGTRSFAIGRAAVDRENVSEGQYAAMLAPYGSSPFIPTDTNRPALVRPMVTLEGAQGIALGKWRLGLALGYQALENNSSHAAAAQIGRRSATGMTIGAARRFAGSWSGGILARRLLETEVLRLIPNPTTIRVYPLDGYLNVQPSDHSPIGNPFFRRADRAGTVLGGGLATVNRGNEWTLYAQRELFQERQIADISSKPPTTRWRMGGYTGGAGVRLLRDRKQVAMQTHYAAYHGATEGTSGRPAGFRTETNKLTFAAELRYNWPESPWHTAVTLAAARQHQNAHDDAARAATNITAWQPAAAVELARRFGRRLQAGASFGVAQYTPFATIPEPGGRGTAYETLIAPAIEVAAATARSHHQAATFSWRTRTAALTLRFWRANIGAVTTPGPVVTRPGGSRAVWGMFVGLIPHP